MSATLNRSAENRELFVGRIARIERVIRDYQNYRRPAVTNGAAAMIADVYERLRLASLDSAEANLLKLKRVLFCIDHPEFEFEIGPDRLILCDRNEVHFRLECM